ncbi:cobyric acid synthase, partial [Chloroflexota bacterium]
RGDISLLKPGLDFLEEKTGKSVLGVIPYIWGTKIAQEDSVFLEERQPVSTGKGLDIAIIRLPHISNYDDFDPLEEMGCVLRFITESSELGNPDLIILPGTKSTVADLIYLQQRGIAQAIMQQAKTGVPIIGICGGYQMLGKAINDSHQVESKNVSVAGLGLLDIVTDFSMVKTTTQIKARVIANNGLFEGLRGMELTGYEIHMGQTKSQNYTAAFQVVEIPQGKAGYFDGSASDDSLVFGSYIHGLFHNQGFTHALLNRLRHLRGLPPVTAILMNKDKQYNELARVVRENLNMRQFYKITLGREYV